MIPLIPILVAVVLVVVFWALLHERTRGGFVAAVDTALRFVGVVALLLLILRGSL